MTTVVRQRREYLPRERERHSRLYTVRYHTPRPSYYWNGYAHDGQNHGMPHGASAHSFGYYNPPEIYHAVNVPPKTYEMPLQTSSSFSSFTRGYDNDRPTDLPLPLTHKFTETGAKKVDHLIDDYLHYQKPRRSYHAVVHRQYEPGYEDIYDEEDTYVPPYRPPVAVEVPIFEYVQPTAYYAPMTTRTYEALDIAEPALASFDHKAAEANETYWYLKRRQAAMHDVSRRKDDSLVAPLPMSYAHYQRNFLPDTTRVTRQERVHRSFDDSDLPQARRPPQHLLDFEEFSEFLSPTKPRARHHDIDIAAVELIGARRGAAPPFKKAEYREFDNERFEDIKKRLSSLRVRQSPQAFEAQYNIRSLLGRDRQRGQSSNEKSMEYSLEHRPSFQKRVHRYESSSPTITTNTYQNVERRAKQLFDKEMRKKKLYEPYVFEFEKKPQKKFTVPDFQPASLPQPKYHPHSSHDAKPEVKFVKLQREKHRISEKEEPERKVMGKLDEPVVNEKIHSKKSVTFANDNAPIEEDQVQVDVKPKKPAEIPLEGTEEVSKAVVSKGGESEKNELADHLLSAMDEPEVEPQEDKGDEIVDEEMVQVVTEKKGKVDDIEFPAAEKKVETTKKKAVSTEEEAKVYDAVTEDKETTEDDTEEILVQVEKRNVEINLDGAEEVEISRVSKGGEDEQNELVEQLLNDMDEPVRDDDTVDAQADEIVEEAIEVAKKEVGAPEIQFPDEQE